MADSYIQLLTPYTDTSPLAKYMEKNGEGIHHIGYRVDSCDEVLEHIKAGKIRALAISTPQRLPQLPDVPTFDEKNIKGFDVTNWYSIMGPKGLPKDIETRLVAAIKKAYDSKDYQDFLVQRGFGATWAAEDAFAKYMAKGDADMGTVMKSLGMAK